MRWRGGCGARQCGPPLPSTAAPLPELVLKLVACRRPTSSTTMTIGSRSAGSSTTTVEGGAPRALRPRQHAPMASICSNPYGGGPRRWRDWASAWRPAESSPRGHGRATPPFSVLHSGAWLDSWCGVAKEARRRCGAEIHPRGSLRWQTRGDKKRGGAGPRVCGRTAVAHRVTQHRGGRAPRRSEVWLCG
jgi:hypothetical protein